MLSASAPSPYGLPRPMLMQPRAIGNTDGPVFPSWTLRFVSTTMSSDACSGDVWLHELEHRPLDVPRHHVPTRRRRGWRLQNRPPTAPEVGLEVRDRVDDEGGAQCPHGSERHLVSGDEGHAAEQCDRQAAPGNDETRLHPLARQRLVVRDGPIDVLGDHRNRDADDFHRDFLASAYG